MSDDEEVMRSDEEGEEEAAEEPAAEEAASVHSEEEEEEEAKDEGPSEAQLAMQKRRQQQTSSTSGLDEEAQELLEQNRVERSKMDEEITELKERSIIRKREREKEEREMAERREAEEQGRRAGEVERKRVKEEEEQNKREERAEKMAEMNKWKNPQSPNFVITRKDRPAGEGGDDDEEHEDKKSPEQLEAEKRAILKQRVAPAPDTGNMDAAKLAEKARELHALLFRLQSEKYDLSRRFKAQMSDMQELAERARSQNKVGKQGNIKRIQLGEDESDTIQERFAGCPARIVMYSMFERQMDKRNYGGRKEVFKGAVYGYAAAKIAPTRKLLWDEDTGLPSYEDIPGAARPEEEEEEEE